MTLRRRPKPPTERDLAALADGSLAPGRRAGIERAVAASPQLQSELAAQRRALDAIGAAVEPAPVSLRARLALAGPPPRRRAFRAPGRVFRAPGRAVTAGVLTAMVGVLATVAVLIGAGTGRLTVAQASVVAARPAQAPAPPALDGGGTLADLSAAGLAFPYWEDAFDFRATGVRHDRVGGRMATTVFYVRGPARVAYTIVDGAPLPAGARTQSATLGGVSLRALSTHGRTVVTWVRAGHTCVLTASATGLSTLLRLASWRHGGQVAY